MDEMFRKATRMAIYVIAVSLMAWAFAPTWRTVAAGIVLGVSASLMNALLLRRRVDWLGKITVEQGPRKLGLGMAGRLATVLLAVLIAHRYPDDIHLPTTLFACFFMPFASLIFALIQSKRQL
ncbi:ATP synthase protein I [Paenibacillus phyllosphaerae]|uniref:ATP synthase protein I n=1 Tax=Paenibacillus phyllosphaerae TaxID=274593 RepID=A0A7W5AXH1_9BACL|nr:ATP synthase subunit I [Paenibacillus phyllosphaerae]MBB3110583.1 ATP synthase protein I [Paenibacillus phyllosphaerae]